MKEITQKGQILRSRRNRQMKSDQERETMDKTTLCYCTPHLHKLVCKAPYHCGVGCLLVHIMFKTRLFKPFRGEFALSKNWFLSLKFTRIFMVTLATKYFINCMDMRNPMNFQKSRFNSSQV